MADFNKCEHTACGCPAADDANYCSDHCKEAVAQDISEIACDCGHPNCG